MASFTLILRVPIGDILPTIGTPLEPTCDLELSHLSPNKTFSFYVCLYILSKIIIYRVCRGYYIVKTNFF